MYGQIKQPCDFAQTARKAKPAPSEITVHRLSPVKLGPISNSALKEETLSTCVAQVFYYIPGVARPHRQRRLATTHLVLRSTDRGLANTAFSAKVGIISTWPTLL